jgi:hypothetical protein
VHPDVRELTRGERGAVFVRLFDPSRTLTHRHVGNYAIEYRSQNLPLGSEILHGAPDSLPAAYTERLHGDLMAQYSNDHRYEGALGAEYLPNQSPQLEYYHGDFKHPTLAVYRVSLFSD